MRTEKEVKARLREIKKSLKDAEERFERYDNHDDLDDINRHAQSVNVLTWVLEEPCSS